MFPTANTPQIQVEPKSGSVVRTIAYELLRHPEGRTGYEISKSTGLANGPVSRALAKLDTCGCDLVVRTEESTGNRVAYRFALTDAGRAFAKRILARRH
jgi:DNA-binding MarR family transcriptional regulator